jgi:hypothetical protein
MKKYLPIIFLVPFFSTYLLPNSAAAQAYIPQDSMTVAIAPEYNEVSSLHRRFLGENYRKLWATPVKVRVLHINKEKGGLKISKLGGGNQTRSIRFVDAQGKEWVLRTIQKYPDRALPESLKPTIARDIIQDQVSTGHPFGALIVPPLAAALGLGHSNPEIVYVGDDPGLQEYRKAFANAVYLFEERAPLEFEDTDNTLKVQEKLQEDNDHVSDQRITLRARLLDFVLGDWDRHEDNWRWSKEKKSGVTVYTAIPRDRDKVFYKTSGIFPWILSHQWLKSNLQPYSEDIRDIKTWNYNARFFDRYFLNGLSEAVWREEISYVQKTLTPGLVQRSIQLMPAEITRENGRTLSSALNERVKNLERLGLEYYRFLARTVEVPASDKREYFRIDHQPNGDIDLSVLNIKKDSTTGRIIYRRLFKNKETEEIRLYGFAADDVFDVTGSAKSDIVVRMVGGEGKDVFKVDPALKDRGKNVVYDRLDQASELPSSSLARLKLANDTLVNTYNKNSFLFDQFGPLFRLSYSVDQGFQPGVGLVYEKQGFRKVPYAFRNEFWVNYSTGRGAFHITYSGDFKEVLGKNDLKIDVNVLGPNNQSNFFGLGNESIFVNRGRREISYYRNHYDYLTADLKLKRGLGAHLTVEGGLATEYYRSSFSANDRRFLQEYDANNPSEGVFDDRFYAGLIGIVTYDSRNDAAMPSRGIYWRTSVTGKQQIGRQEDTYGSLQTEFRFYVNPGNSGFVIANRLGGGTTIGAPTFYQRMQLGGVRNLRGFHSNRFTGKTAAYYNIDLRMKLFNFTSYITPGAVGLIAFNDIGRVWEPGTSSNTWHDGYGGGLYVTPAELILLQGAVGFSKEGALPYISIGFSF